MNNLSTPIAAQEESKSLTPYTVGDPLHEGQRILFRTIAGGLIVAEINNIPEHNDNYPKKKQMHEDYINVTRLWQLDKNAEQVDVERNNTFAIAKEHIVAVFNPEYENQLNNIISGHAKISGEMRNKLAKALAGEDITEEIPNVPQAQEAQVGTPKDVITAKMSPEKEFSLQLGFLAHKIGCLMDGMKVFDKIPKGRIEAINSVAFDFHFNTRQDIEDMAPYYGIRAVKNATRRRIDALVKRGETLQRAKEFTFKQVLLQVKDIYQIVREMYKDAIVHLQNTHRKLLIQDPGKAKAIHQKIKYMVEKFEEQKANISPVVPATKASKARRHKKS